MTEIDHNKGVYFKGDYYPKSFKFYPEYNDQKQIEEFKVIGKVIPYLLNMPEQLIVWSQGMVVTLTPENYKKKRNNGKTK